MDLSFIGDIFASGGLAGITGLISGILTRRQERLIKEQDQNHELEMTKLSIMELREEQKHELAVANKQIQRAETEGKIQIESREMDGFVVSQKNNTDDGAIKWVRPIITGYLLLLATFVSVKVTFAVGGLGALGEDVLIDLVLRIVDGVFFLTTLAVGWFFGSRGNSKKK